MKTGLMYDSRFLKHDPGETHPESPSRLEVSYRHLENLPWFSSLSLFSPRAAEEEWIATVHSPDYIHHVKTICASGQTLLDTPDVGISRDSFEIAKLAVGGAFGLADQMMAEKIQNGFALLRPPGHHAENGMAMGFCIFNTIAVLARYLQKKHHLDKVLILDWDAHHGNGTQHTFEEDPSVFYMSLHQFPFYPGTGDERETGIGRGKGSTLNCPMRARSGDDDYQTVFREKILPAVDAFKPDAILISAGFDAHRFDPLANLYLSTNFFGWMSERMVEAAERHAKGRLISILEGGYNLGVLPQCIAKHIGALSGHVAPA
ncbi:MAG: histone deacetylase [Candidatus Omnitrophica bacterium CG11_big_fil_rev_8_21_14_0_20_45_26]|uniref:Histone deacetylase n=1 Tax=Candidatus Abzuiibacterium crystallinum TaxID=1974748 RepID=A0A2H0LND4_9BACT|nr:MAG: histone deacetylase [Candidatus Omnitrophica bacterium CG11_big_fil_rev_8_21_14_0_20_45_26]PIW63918.1 MAG: histone deacetylase [Candidatus Omnitrophica bacterium CG12_big_fil_rev_8_21_14_0_65_45_16]